MSTKKCITFFLLIVSCSGQEGIPDNSVLWVSRDQHLYFSSQLQNWTDAIISPREFAQSITIASLLNTEAVYGIAGDIPTRHLVTSDIKKKFIMIYDLDVMGGTYFHMGTSKDIGHLAIDWLGRNVYWTDAGFGWISMKRLPENIYQTNSVDPNFRLVVDTFLEKPTGIAIHPEKYFLFWTDTGSTPKIERSNLIGQKRKIIVWQSIVTPTTLCIDQSTDRLYWSDPARRTIEYSDFHGNGRKILVSDPDVNYYGIAVFRDSLIFTAPNFNRTGYVSLKENNEGEQIQSSIDIQNIKFFNVMAYAPELQDEPTDALCKSVNECEQICLHMERDAGFTCLCDDGYDLISGRYCAVDEKVLERHIMFTNDDSICTVPISVLVLETSEIFNIHCDVVQKESYITRFAVDMGTKMIFYTNSSTIFKQPAFKEDERQVLYETDGKVTDMDFDWISGQLYWIEEAEGRLYYIHISSSEVHFEELGADDVISIAVDPHNKVVYWISMDSEGKDNNYALNEWRIPTKTSKIVSTSLLSKPSDLEYDRVKDRLLWNDNNGHIGMIYTDGTEERKYDTVTSGEQRHAVTVYKNFIISTTDENRQFDISYELDGQLFSLNLHKAYDGPVQDVHVFESALQQIDLEPCEVNNGNCEHVCLPESGGQCVCFLGYFLDEDKTSCRSAILDDNYFVVLDTVHGELYQVNQETKDIHVIETRPDNVPAGLAYDSTRKDVIWIDENINAVKRMKLGSTEETAVMSGVDYDAAIAVDISTGNIYVTSGREIIVVSPSLNTLTIVDSTFIKADIGMIALMPEAGTMAWFEGNTRIVLANMDGTNVRPITVQEMEKAEDIAFDLDDERGLYWCDSVLDKIEKIDTKSLASTIVYQGRGLKPVAIEVVADFIFLIPGQQRRIVQINKSDGLQQRDVLESPLFGSLNNFFISRQSVKGHRHCKDCNGGCSNLCLPIGKSKRCACSEGVSLKEDESTCRYAADVCPKETYSSVPGLLKLDDCCPNAPGAICQPKCSPGLVKSYEVVMCKHGEWNVTLGEICKEAVKGDEASYVTYIAVGGGGIVLLIIVIVGVCLYRRRNSKMKHKDAIQGHDRGHEYETSNGNMRGYATADGILSPDPPPARETKPEVEVYDYLNESEMVDVGKLKVDMPPQGEGIKKVEDRRSSTTSGRYSKWPIENDGYLTASYTQSIDQEPQPDYHINGYLADGYLRPSSISSSSQRGSVTAAFDQDQSYRNHDLQSNDSYYRDSGNISGGQVSFTRGTSSSRYTQNVEWHA